MATYKYETLTVDSTSGGVGFTESNITVASTQYFRECKEILCTLETAPVRFRVDGTAPTSTVGHLLNVGDVVKIDGADASKFKAIRTTDTSGVLQCSYEV